MQEPKIVSISGEDILPTMMIDVNLIDVVDQPMPEQSDSEKQLLMKSIKTSGLINGIVVQYEENTGRYIVKDGRTRLEVVKKLGHKYIKCIPIKDLNDLLPLELEVFRRHLDKDTLNRYRKECEERSEKIPENLRNSIEKRLNPNMKITFKTMCENGISKAWQALFWMIARLPHEEQDAFFKSKVVEVDTDESKDIIEELQDRVAELDQEKAEQKTAIENIKKNIQDMLKKKEKELEEKWKEKNLSKTKIAETIEEEKKKLSIHYEKELEESRKKLVELSKTQKEAQEKIDILNRQIKVEEGSKKEYQLLAQKMKDELNEAKNVLRDFSPAPQVQHQIIGVAEELKRSYGNAVKVGADNFSKEQKTEIINAASKIRDIIIMIEELFQEETKLKKIA